MAPAQSLRYAVVMIANGCHGANGVRAILLVVALHRGIGLARIHKVGLVACFAKGPRMRQECAKSATHVPKTVFGMAGKIGGLVHKPVASLPKDCVVASRCRKLWDPKGSTARARHLKKQRVIIRPLAQLTAGGLSGGLGVIVCR